MLLKHSGHKTPYLWEEKNIEYSIMNSMLIIFYVAYTLQAEACRWGNPVKAMPWALDI